MIMQAILFIRVRTECIYVEETVQLSLCKCCKRGLCRQDRVRRATPQPPKQSDRCQSAACSPHCGQVCSPPSPPTTLSAVGQTTHVQSTTSLREILMSRSAGKSVILSSLFVFDAFPLQK